MWQVNECAAPINKVQRERLQQLSSAALCDGMQALGIEPGCMHAAVKCVTAAERVLGTAYTVRATNGNSFPVHYAIYTARPDYVLVVDTDSYEQAPYLGELMALNAMNIGLSGLVIDGYVRDAVELSKMDYPIFCRGFIPRKPGKERCGGVNIQINCAGVRVCPGDVIFGDADGVVVIPRAQLDEIIDAAEQKNAIDEQRKLEILEFFEGNFANQSGKDIREIIPKDIQAAMK